MTHVAFLLVGKAIIGPLVAPVLASRVLLLAYRDDRAAYPGATGRLPRVWARARPALDSMSTITVMASFALGFLYLLLAALAALVLALSARRDLRRRRQ